MSDKTYWFFMVLYCYLMISGKVDIASPFLAACGVILVVQKCTKEILAALEESK
tara:strand:+ start:185 stop:346 length:162 start_codon:yes stop_codon:yes gene_type:complete